MEHADKPSNGHDEVDLPQKLFSNPVQDMDLPSGYVSFEQLIGILLWSLMENRLEAYKASTTIETTSMDRQYRVNCVPSGWMPPFGWLATLELDWPADYTFLSLEGDEGVCLLYHDDDEPCTHHGRRALMFVELTVQYHVPYDVVSDLNSDEGIEAFARRIQQAHAEQIDHENVVDIIAQAIFDGEELSLTSMVAQQTWVLEEELSDLPILTSVLSSICEEIQRMLLRFDREFPANARSQK